MKKISLVLSLLALSASLRAAPLKVYATTPDLADLVRQVGGEAVKVESLSRGFQDPHFVEAKPSLIAKLMGADLLVQTGLELEMGWAPLLVQSARNPKLFPGGKGFLDASRFITALEVPAIVSRAGGDIHPGGNPHYLLNPENASPVAKGIAAKLAELDPANAAMFQRNLAVFEKALAAQILSWKKILAPYKGAKFVSYHRNTAYFAQCFGLESVGEIEPKPGIPPSAGHTADLRKTMAAANCRLILTQPFFERRTADALARDTGAAVVTIALGPDGGPNTAGYLATMDANVQAVEAALSSKP